MLDDFRDLEEFIARKMRQIDSVKSVRESLDTVIATPAGEVEEAAGMLFAARELTKLYKEVGDACQVFLKSTLPTGKASAGRYAINHYERKAFDSTAWKHWCQTDEEVKPLWAAFQELEAIKKRDKEQFQFIDSSVKVTLLEVGE